ncbi:hypothetical protein FACS1894116_10590 [Betaproteobacteria bacterium]|nr:hypothetical protein FACS1894116_10590 [Betaproteobacteria bacterium]GHU22900.1 hypothetical protein FACS189488_04360 [Betaproteobacteria bacterium]
MGTQERQAGKLRRGIRPHGQIVDHGVIRHGGAVQQREPCGTEMRVRVRGRGRIRHRGVFSWAGVPIIAATNNER